MIFPWDTPSNDVEYRPTEDQFKEPTGHALLGFIETMIDGVSLFVSAFDFSSIEGYKTINQKQAELIAQNPKFAIQNRNDGYDLETEKLLAIQQKSSRGFSVYDINPAMLDELEYPLGIHPEFIFDGVNFAPGVNGSLGHRFRTVEIPQAGTWLKVEFLNENNTFENFNMISSLPGSPIRPYAQRKYAQIIDNDIDLSSPSPATFANYTQNVVFINFNSKNEKPLRITRSGDVIETYFSDLTLTLAVGAPKVRITIGFNSEMRSGDMPDAINANLETQGMARLIGDTDSILHPYHICEADIEYSNLSASGRGVMVTGGQPTKSETYMLVRNEAVVNVSTHGSESGGYGVFWISNISASIMKVILDTMISARVVLFVTNSNNQISRVFTKEILIAANERSTGFDITFPKPIRVVLPCYNSLMLRLYLNSSGTAQQQVSFYFNMVGYSAGELIKFNPPGVFISKTFTDACLLPQMNRRLNINGV